MGSPKNPPTSSLRSDEPITPVGPPTSGGAGLPPAGSRLQDLVRSERTMVVARSVGVPWALIQVLAYELPYPPGFMALGLALVALLGAGNLAVWLVLRRTATGRGAQRLAIASLGMDAAVLSGFVWLYTFDPRSALWAVLFILPLEGAIKFQLVGSLGAWAGMTGHYVVREAWGSATYDYAFEWDNISFRMGIAFIIALVAGLMARDLVEQRAKLFKALAHSRDVDELRAALVSTLAHEIRNPLTSIRGVHRMLATKLDEMDADTARQMILTADRQSERLQRLATGLLDLARLEEGRLELSLEEVPLRAAIEEAVSYLEQPEPVDIRVDPEMRVHADPERLQQIVLNLAANAVTYGAPPFVIEANRADGRVEMAVIDHGAGIPAEQRRHLFEAFRPSSGKGSVGLGLAIVKALAEAQGGAVSYQENRPTGARFTVTLPRRSIA